MPPLQGSPRSPSSSFSSLARQGSYFRVSTLYALEPGQEYAPIWTGLQAFLSLVLLSPPLLPNIGKARPTQRPALDKPYDWTRTRTNLKLVMQNPTPIDMRRSTHDWRNPAQPWPITPSSSRFCLFRTLDHTPHLARLSRHLTCTQNCFVRTRFAASKGTCSTQKPLARLSTSPGPVVEMITTIIGANRPVWTHRKV